jgi:hypothetical protein
VTPMRLGRKQACIDCHFLMKQSFGVKLGVSTQDRAALRGGDCALGDAWSLGCYMGVWDEGYGSAKRDRFQIVAATDRHRYCFFWPFRAGMFFTAGQVLQERESENAEAKRDRRLTIVGLWIAALALLANLVVTFYPDLARLAEAIVTLLSGGR